MATAGGSNQMTQVSAPAPVKFKVLATSNDMTIDGAAAVTVKGAVSVNTTVIVLASMMAIPAAANVAARS